METKDLTLAAFLRVKGYTLSHVEKVGKHGIFHYDDVPPALISNYDRGVCEVEPQLFHNAIKALTTLVNRAT